VPAPDALAVLDAVPTEQVPAAILRLTARLVATPRPEVPDDLLTVEQAAALLRQSRRWVWTHGREGAHATLRPYFKDSAK
jgi:hypothetical protein